MDCEYECVVCKKRFIALHFKDFIIATGRRPSHCGEVARWIRNIPDSGATENVAEAPKNRIAVHMLGSLALPLMKGEAGSPERIASCSEIEELLQVNEYAWEDYGAADYVIAEEWFESEECKGFIHFKPVNGYWNVTQKDRAIFETENPEFLKGLDSQLEEGA